jgi:hypothetical protein
MSGGVRYWNEETQRWEDDDGTRTLSTQPTPPPPARPDFAPVGTGEGGVPEGGGSEGDASPGEGVGADSGGPGGSLDAGGDGDAGGDLAASGESSEAGPAAGAPAAGQSAGQGAEPASGVDGWHGPATGGGGSGGWPATQVSAGGSAVRDPDAPAGESGGAAAAGGVWPSTPQPPAPQPSTPQPLTPAAPPASPGPAPAAPWPGQAWPPGDQVVAPAPTGGMSRRTVWSVLIGAAAVGVAVSLVLTLVVRSGDDKKDDAVVTESSSPAVDVSRQGEPEVSPTPTEETSSPGPTAPEVPAGYELFEDPEGFRIVRPEGWTRGTVASQYGIAVVNYRSADSTRRLQVYQVAEASPDASFDLYLSGETAKPAGFEQVSLDNLDDPATGFTGSRLEYLADRIKGEPEVGTWHVYDERFVAQDGFIYAIAAYGPDSDGGEDELALLTTALAGFCAPYACDPASID